MNLLEIILILIGIIAIIISCLIVDKESKNTDNKAADFALDYLTDGSKKMISDKLESALSDISEEIIVRTDDALDKLSNEKIMAVNDFSEQILEKIRRNHEEVVFLYSMLEDKEKELKAVIKEIDLSEKKVQAAYESKQNRDLTLKTDNDYKATNAQADSLDEQAQDNIIQIDDTELTDNNRINSQAAKIRDKKTHTAALSTTENTAARINNQKILELYSQGMSVLEISKQLELGQGEVKLVIDLFKGKK